MQADLTEFKYLNMFLNQMNPIIKKSILPQFNIIKDNWGDDYYQFCDELLELLHKMKYDTKKVFTSYIFDYMKDYLRFVETGEYGNGSFEEIKKNIYDNESVMIDNYLPGLLMCYAFTILENFKIKYYKDNFLSLIKPNTIGVEVGFGDGIYILHTMNQKKSCNMIGYDVSLYAVQFVENLLEHTNIKKSRYKLETGNLCNKLECDSFFFDWGIIAEVIEHVPDALAGLNEMYRILKDNGLLFLTTVIDANHRDHILNFKDYTEVEEFVKKAGFEIIKYNIDIVADILPNCSDKAQGISIICQKKVIKRR